MKTFTYSPFLRFLYRYGNIPITIILLLYAVPLIVNLDSRLSYIIPLVIVLLLVYLLNKHYLELYSILPYKIEADEEKLITSEYLFSNKIVTIYFNDIMDLQGGIFEGKLRGAMKIVDGRNRNVFAFYQNITNGQLLQTIILSKVKRELYEQTLQKIKSKRKITKGE